MKKLLQTLKEKWAEYLLEILVITIGILGAFALNNWNESRKAEIAEKQLLSSMLDDLKVDHGSIKNGVLRMDRIISTQIDMLRVHSGDLSFDSLEATQRIRGALLFQSAAKVNHPEIASSISDQEVKNRINDYYLSLSNFENVYQEFEDIIIRTIRPYLGENLVYNNAYHLNEANRSEMLLRGPLKEVIAQPAFGQILFEAHLKAKGTRGMLQSLQEANEQLKEQIEEYLK